MINPGLLFDKCDYIFLLIDTTTKNVFCEVKVAFKQQLSNRFVLELKLESASNFKKFPPDCCERRGIKTTTFHQIKAKTLLSLTAVRGRNYELAY